MTRAFWLMVMLTMLSMTVNAQSSDDNKTKESEKWHWDLQVNMGAVFYNNPLKGVEQDEFIDYVELALSFDLYYKGFFIQSNRRRSNPADVDIGYQIASDENWAVDAIVKSYFEDISEDDLLRSNASHLIPRDEALGFALRYSYYLDDAVLSVDIANIDTESSNSGWAVESFYSYLIPYRNWEIYLGTGITFFSADTVNYYVGISEEEATSQVGYYRPGAAYELEAEAHAIYPLAEDWTLRFGITKSYLSDNYSKSPIGIRSNTTYIKLGVNYVF